MVFFFFTYCMVNCEFSGVIVASAVDAGIARENFAASRIMKACIVVVRNCFILDCL